MGTGHGKATRAAGQAGRVAGVADWLRGRELHPREVVYEATQELLLPRVGGQCSRVVAPEGVAPSSPVPKTGVLLLNYGAVVDPQGLAPRTPGLQPGA